VLGSRDRKRTAADLVRTAPARGLTLMEVIYQPESEEETS